eukprot:COSAG04_NODE_1980_length_5091_cov_5.303085_5_plen_133_part_00
MPQGGGDSAYLPDSNVYGGGDSIIDGGMAPLPGWFSDGVVMAGGGEPLEPPPGGDEHEEEEHEEHGDDDDEEEEEDVGAAAVERRQAAMQPEPSGTHQTPALSNCSNPCSVQLLLGQVICHPLPCYCSQQAR